MKRLEITPEITGLEVRAAGDGPEHFTIRGHAAVFNRLSENLGGFRERIAPGAFSKVLDGTPDVRLLIDHDPSTVLARTTNGTLELREDPQGLHIWARIRSDLPEAPGLRARLETGLIDQMSFAFSVDKENDVRSGEDDAGVPIYEVREAANLYDVSPVTYGAYPQTDISLVRMRMLDSDEPMRLKDLPELARRLVDQRDERDATFGELESLENAGSYTVGGSSINWTPELARRIGILPQDMAHMTPEEIARVLADRPEQRENSPAAEVPAAVVVPDRELIRKRLALRKKARLLVATYPLG